MGAAEKEKPMTDDRIARYEQRREELQQMTDEQLKARFWELCDQLVDPLINLARTHTSPSIERAVLLRMGIDSLSSQGVVERIYQAGLLGKGAGHVLLKLAEKRGTDIKSAAKAILDDKDILQDLFRELARSGG
jgi:D-ornithine 4,5-aminomutase subunit alpha